MMVCLWDMNMRISSINDSTESFFFFNLSVHIVRFEYVLA